MNHNGITVNKSDHPTRPWLVNVAKSLFGKQIRKRFKTRRQAELQAHSYTMKLKSKEQTPLEPETHKVVALFQDKLSAAQIMMALTDAVELHGLASNTLEELGNEFITHQKMLNERGSVSDVYVSDCEYFVLKTVKYLGNPQINAITTEDLDEFVNMRLEMRHKNGKLHSPRSVINEINFLSALFNYGMRKGHMVRNPTLEVKMPDYKPEVGICKPEDLEKLLEHADHFIQCHIMFGAFGGLRSSEIMRMDWSDVRLDEGQFYINGTKNSNAERWVQLTPPLMHFCKQLLESDNPPKGLVMGGMVQNTKQRKLKRLFTATGVRIPANGLRHSYGSHHLVHFENATKSAQEMGHVGPQQTFKAYRKAVLKSQAAEFFAIRPKAKAWVVSAGMGIKKPRKMAA